MFFYNDRPQNFLTVPDFHCSSNTVLIIGNNFMVKSILYQDQNAKVVGSTIIKWQFMVQLITFQHQSIFQLLTTSDVLIID